MSLQATAKLLEDVQVVVDAPARIAAALASKVGKGGLRAVLSCIAPLACLAAGRDWRFADKALLLGP